MAAGQAVSSRSVEKPQGSTDAGSVETGIKNTALEEARWRPVLGLLCEVSVDLPLPNFRVADFLQLKAGSVMATGWRLTRDIPLRVNGTLIAWGEFEGSGGRLGVRITEIA